MEIPISRVKLEAQGRPGHPQLVQPPAEPERLPPFVPTNKYWVSA